MAYQALHPATLLILETALARNPGGAPVRVNAETLRQLIENNAAADKLTREREAASLQPPAQ